jgi:beta-glucuronidase
MIRPQNSRFREAIDLSGLWRIGFDLSGAADGAPPPDGPDCLPIAVPGSWNEQLAESGFMNHVGRGWYHKRFEVPERWQGRRVALRFGSADQRARVWVDGAEAGGSDVAHMPFEVDITSRGAGALRMCVEVDATLPEQGPTQRVTKADYIAEGRVRDEYLPAVRYDFFPYGGIHRPVHLTCAPLIGIRDVRLRSSVENEKGRLQVEVWAHPAVARVVARDETGGEAIALVPGKVDPDTGWALHAGALEGIGPARFWSPASPHLFRLLFTASGGDGADLDEVRVTTGVKDVRVEGDRLLLNGAPVELKGFGKHEDSPIRGRGLDLPQLVKDFQLLKWCGANSVRTSHYPYAEEFYDLADEMGIMVIDEVFSINLDFRKVRPEGLAAHKEAVRRLIARDGHRACVIAWSLANEPGYLGEKTYAEASAPYWKELFAHARALDPTRPLTHANVGYAGLDDPAFGQSDFVMINRYYGWYQEPGQLDLAVGRLRADFDHLAAAHGKPILVSEFGADAIAGQHATTPQLFTEDYQAELIEAYWAAIAAHPSVIGGHVWNFADFRTAQHSRRAVMNLKGVFTRDRTPKRAAHALRRLWSEPAASNGSAT